jgi:hypothetical protein
MAAKSISSNSFRLLLFTNWNYRVYSNADPLCVHCPGDVGREVLILCALNMENDMEDMKSVRFCEKKLLQA